MYMTEVGSRQRAFAARSLGTDIEFKLGVGIHLVHLRRGTKEI